jgi:hypothetical protein
MSGVFNIIAKVINKYIKQYGAKGRSLKNTRKPFKRCRMSDGYRQENNG